MYKNRRKTGRGKVLLKGQPGVSRVADQSVFGSVGGSHPSGGPEAEKRQRQRGGGRQGVEAEA